MSWQAYVDTSLIGTGNLDKAAIFSAAGDSKWAVSAGFNVKPEELKEIVASFTDKGDADGIKKVQKDGFHVAGERYVVLRSDERSLYGKKGREGMIIVKTTQAILICHYPETIQPGAATNSVEQLADYLIGVGY